nr:ammonia-forming cytochrome c nitrite reductase subunit c552 [uncultured Desulfuromonas sp.]
MPKKHFFSARLRVSLFLLFLLSAIMIAVNGNTITSAHNTRGIPTKGLTTIELGKTYPAQYESWKATAEPTPADKSKYKRGYDTDGILYSKIDEYPYLALLLNGWGYGAEFTEPRGHVYMIEDQVDIEPTRLKAGGSCLSCKTPYAQDLQTELGEDYFKKSYAELRDDIPAQDQLLGVTCVDCHNTDDLSLKISRGFTLGKALPQIGKQPSDLSNQDKRSLVCAQCHVTYTMPKNAQMKTTDVLFPWSGSQWGNISVENIIATIKSDPTYKEWTQSVTGFKLGFVRHPEFEFFSKDSPHWQAGLSCADCHMPSTDAADQTISDHRIMSPLKNDLTACAACHTEEPNSLREMVFAIQDNTATAMINTGYALAGVAKLFELAHHSSAAGTITTTSFYQQAKEAYEQAFYRLMFIQNENSTGFHNPPEATRILNDTEKYTNTAERLLREAIITSGITIPEIVDLELDQYLYNRGNKKLNFNPDMEIVLPQTPHYPDSLSEEPHQIKLPSANAALPQ